MGATSLVDVPERSVSHRACPYTCAEDRTATAVQKAKPAAGPPWQGQHPAGSSRKDPAATNNGERARDNRLHRLQKINSGVAGLSEQGALKQDQSTTRFPVLVVPARG